MYFGDHRKDLGLLATSFVHLVPIQRLFVRVVPIQHLFPCDHNPQSRGITGLLDMKRLLFAQMGRGTIQCAFTVQLQCNFRSMAPFTPGFTVSLGQFGQSSVAFRRSALSRPLPNFEAAVPSESCESRRRAVCQPWVSGPLGLGRDRAPSGFVNGARWRDIRVRVRSRVR